MVNSGLFGPYNLDVETIDKVVKGKGAGTYVLERENNPNYFTVNYVGRSDDDLNGRVKKWCGNKYRRFKYAFYSKEEEAFEKECEIYHNFGGFQGKLDNEIHPDSPKNKDCKCPVC